MRRALALLLASTLPGAALPPSFSFRKGGFDGGNFGDTSTPIKHLVVIFQENISFDHYFGTYPQAANPVGEPRFRALRGTPSVNGFTPGLLVNNPNALNAGNGDGAVNPFRLSRAQASTADQDHDYLPEQLAFDKGLMDLFPMSVGVAGPPPSAPPVEVNTKGLTMGYYDGNTVTALWNYAQHFAMSDNSYGTTFGPSTVGALNLVSGQTNGVVATRNGTADSIDGGNGSSTVIGDPDPVGDVCSGASTAQVQMGGANIGNLLSNAGITWGWFNGGFDLAVTNPNGSNGCARSTTSLVTNQKKPDYSPHHEPFQYYPSTANPTHARPSSIAAIGHDGDAANHQYDIDDFYAALKAGNFPAVSFLKAPAYQDGHAGYSDPLDEQAFIVHVVNLLQTMPDWKQTAVIVAYDDSDGWYDHQMGPIVNQSTTSADGLTATGACGNGGSSLPGIDAGNLHAQGRCGYGPRLPLLVISPYAKKNYVDHAVTDQTSILRFIEDNWLGGQRIGGGSFDSIANSINGMFEFRRESDNRTLFLNESTGLVEHSNSDSDNEQ